MRQVISIDLGATNLRVALVNDRFELLKVSRVKTPKDKEKLFEKICELIDKLNISNYGDLRVGISACGFVQNNYIYNLPNLGIVDFDLKNLLMEKYKFRSLAIKNDANATGYAEASYGAARDVDSSFFITISSGIGGVLTSNRKLIDLPFEIGHNYVDYNGELYEAETLLSGIGIVNLSRLNCLKVDSAQQLFELIKQKDENALKVYHIWIKYLAYLFANYQMNYNVDKIILSGGVMKSADIFYDDLIKEFTHLMMPFAQKIPEFVMAKFDQDAGLMGGACVALDNIS